LLVRITHQRQPHGRIDRGNVTGDKKMQAEGKMEKAKGAAHAAVGDAKDTARDATR
jgi:uncharacterized protein YjbJ (UPF0337 family)